MVNLNACFVARHLPLDFCHFYFLCLFVISAEGFVIFIGAAAEWLEFIILQEL